METTSRVRALQNVGFKYRFLNTVRENEFRLAIADHDAVELAVRGQFVKAVLSR
jgi:hypothetical protein